MRKILPMHPEESSLTTKTDVQRINALLRRLCLPRWLWRTSVLVIALLAWIWVGKQILIGGSLVNYSGLQSLGAQVVDFLTRINPYIWWGLTIILSLIVLSLARSWLKASIKSGRQVSVSVGDIQKLAQGMTTEGVDVLLWAWDHEAGPVSVGDLIAARDQLRAGRVRKLATARAQHQVLRQIRDGSPPTAQ
ncbi:MAG TPA: hypothetical protein VIC30_09555 [Orrella sp.]